MLTRDEATTRVARGAAHLDTVRPGWFTKIDTGKLDISNGCLCVLGQVYGGYFDAIHAHGWKQIDNAVMAYSPEAAHIGCSLIPQDVREGSRHETWMEAYRLLQDSWIVAIADRVLEAAQAHSEPASTTALDPRVQPQERCVRARTV